MINETQVKRWLNQDETLSPPHNGPCDRAGQCRYANPRCRRGLDPQDFGMGAIICDLTGGHAKPKAVTWTDKWWEKTHLSAAPNRRWTMCSAWKMTLGMVFDKKSGSWIYQ